MHEVKANPTAVQQSAVASSTGAEASHTKAAEATGKILPVAAAQAGKQAEGADSPALAAADLEQAVAQLNEYIQQEQRDLNFSIDEATGSTVIRVTSSQSGELIRQIPDETFLKLAQEARKQEDLRLINVQA